MVSSLRTTESKGYDGMLSQAEYRGGNSSRWRMLCKQRGGLEKHQDGGDFFLLACFALSALLIWHAAFVMRTCSSVCSQLRSDE